METKANNSTTTLNGSITSGAASLVVTSASSFPTSGNFRILIDTELMLVTAVSGTTFTVTRGIEGTTAASHSNGVSVDGILTSGAMDQLRSDMTISDVYANIPTAALAGRIFIPTDRPVFYYDNGSSWQTCFPSYVFTPPVYANFSWQNSQTGTSATNLGYGVALKTPGSSSENDPAWVCTVPTAPYTITIYHEPIFQNTNYSGVGMCVTDGTKLVIFTNIYNGGLECDVGWLNSGSSFNSWKQTYRICAVTKWMRINDDNTNYNFSISADGFNWTTLYSESHTAFLTATKIGIFLDNNATGGVTGKDVRTTLLHWAQT